MQEINDPAILGFCNKFLALRLDLYDKDIPGNKWFKLKYNIEPALAAGTLLTFGGAYSNHLAAAAAAGKKYGFKTIGIVRGEEPAELNPVLTNALSSGMALHYISREEYKRRNEEGFIKELRVRLGEFYLLPEGGSNALAVKGCSEILSLVNIPFDDVCCAVGTGGTIAGIISSLEPEQQAVGFPVLKDGSFLRDDINELLGNTLTKGKWRLETEYHFGGYAKSTKELETFISTFEKQNAIPLDHVYTGKLMYGVYDLLKKGVFKGRTVLAVHTGGFRPS